MSYARSIVCVALLTWVGVAYGSSQEQAVGSNTKPEDQVTQVERDWLAADAKGDVASDDFIGSILMAVCSTKGRHSRRHRARRVCWGDSGRDKCAGLW